MTATNKQIILLPSVSFLFSSVYIETLHDTEFQAHHTLLLMSYYAVCYLQMYSAVFFFERGLYVYSICTHVCAGIHACVCACEGQRRIPGLLYHSPI